MASGAAQSHAIGGLRAEGASSAIANTELFGVSSSASAIVFDASKKPVLINSVNPFPIIFSSVFVTPYLFFLVLFEVHLFVSLSLGLYLARS